MASCKCFRCGNGFDSINEDDVAGDGKCPNCIEASKRIAFKVDIDMAKKRSEKPMSRIRQLFTEEQILKGDMAGSPRINIKDLGINPNG